MKNSKIIYLLFNLSIFSFSTCVFAENEFNSKDWEFINGAEIQPKDGHKSVYLTRGELEYKGQPLQDGIVEFDMYSQGERGFVYVYFRQISDQESEVVYLRTHKSNAPDTVQYAPVYQGRSAWQIYHGEKGTASATLAAKVWIPVKVEFRGEVLRVWVGDQSAPVIERMRLSRTPVAGGITIRGNTPKVSQADYSAYIRNIKVTPLPTSQIKSTTKQNTELTNIRNIKLSPLFAANKQPIFELPNSLNEKPWSIIEAEPDGVFELLKWRKIPSGVRSWAAAATFNLNSPKQQVCSLYLGFSDAITLQLNDRPIAFADASYRYNQNRQEGLLHAKQMQVFLPLKIGQNTVTATIADSFGGWGLQASLGACEGIVINQAD